jgi:pyruvate dehydrogenase complex dehydrogenase (E1) component
MNHAPQPQNLSPPVVADTDPSETQEWREALLSLATNSGPARVRQVLDELARVARSQRIGWQPRQHSCERIAQSRREGGQSMPCHLMADSLILLPHSWIC